MTAPPRLEASRLGRRAPGSGRWIIDDVDLRVEGGERVAIRGPTGAGKTVLLRARARLDPPDRGRVLWNGGAPRREAVPPFRAQAMYLHQRPALLEGSVEENLRRPFAFRVHRGRSFDRGAALQALEALGRDAAFLERPAAALSGGEAQIVALVRALALDPAFLLLDEPTAALDGETARAAEELVAAWLDADRGRRAVLWVTHDASQAARVAERALELRGGRLRRLDHPRPAEEA